jgi:hypothetical protein
MDARKGMIGVPERYHLDRAGEWLVHLYDAWGKPAKAAEWRARARSVEGDRLSDQIRIGIESPLPQPVAHDHDRVATWRDVLLGDSNTL